MLERATKCSGLIFRRTIYSYMPEQVVRVWRSSTDLAEHRDCRSIIHTSLLSLFARSPHGISTTPRQSFHSAIMFPTLTQGLNWGIPPDLGSGTSYLRSATSNNRSCTSQLTSCPYLLRSTALHSLYLSIFLYAWYFVKKCSPAWSFCHLH